MGFFTRETLVEKLVREIRWLVMHRENNFYRIRPGGNEPNLPVKILAFEDRGHLMMQSELPIRFPLSAATPDLYRTVLLRNRDAWFGKWCLDVTGSCDASLYLSYTALLAGLTASGFRQVCDGLADERDAFHTALRGQLAKGQLLDYPPARSSLSAGSEDRGLPASGGQQEIVWLNG